MSKWEEKRLEDIIDVNPPVKLKKGESYPFIDIDKVSPTRRSVTNEDVKIYDGQSSSKFCDGDTVFSRITPCLENRKIAKVAISSDAAFGSTEFYVFRAKKAKADARFTYYLTSSDAVVLPAINSMTGASGRQRADKRFIQRLKLNLPDLPTQERIADILSAYDDLIETNSRRIELLEQAAQELYKEWFVRFRFPEYENVKFENSLPEGWERNKIQKYYNTCSGGTPSRSNAKKLREYVFDETKWYLIYDLIERYVGLFDKTTQRELCKEFNEVLEDECSGYRFVKGLITPITNKEEIKTIEKATNTKYSAVNTHISKAFPSPWFPWKGHGYFRRQVYYREDVRKALREHPEGWRQGKSRCHEETHSGAYKS